MKYSIILLLLIQIPVKAQNSGPRFKAMGSGGIAVQDIWSLQQNPSGIAELKRPMLALAYEQHYLDKEVSTQTALLILPFHRNVFGFSFDRYGFSEYTEQKLGFAYAKSFGSSFRMAIGLKYHQLYIAQYGSAKAFTAEAGFQFKVSEEFTIASHITNPTSGTYRNLPNSNLPVRLSFGTSYRFNGNMMIVTDIRKSLNYPIDVLMGIEYNFIQLFSIRGGISANPFKQYAGFGINYRNVKVDVAVASHSLLGYSPQIGLGYEF